MFNRRKQSIQGGSAWGGKNNSGKVRRAKVKKTKKRRRKKSVPAKKRKKYTKINWKKMGVLFLMLCFVAFTFWVLFFSGVMNIQKMKVVGYDEKKNEIVDLSKKIGQTKILNQDIDNNLLLFPSEKLIEEIKKEYLVVKDVEIRRIFPNELIIKIIKRKNIFLWQQNEYCRLLDEDANIIEEFQCGNNENSLLKICREKEDKFNLNCLVFLQETDEEISKNKEAVKARLEAGKKILEEIKTTFYFDDEIIFDIPNIISEELRVKSQRNGELWFLVDKNLTKQLKKFRILLEEKINSNDLKNMLYIDLRLNDRIIYRFKEGYGDN